MGRNKCLHKMWSFLFCLFHFDIVRKLWMTSRILEKKNNQKNLVILKMKVFCPNIEKKKWEKRQRIEQDFICSSFSGCSSLNSAQQWFSGHFWYGVFSSVSFLVGRILHILMMEPNQFLWNFGACCWNWYNNKKK